MSLGSSDPAVEGLGYLTDLHWYDEIVFMEPPWSLGDDT